LVYSLEDPAFMDKREIFTAFEMIRYLGNILSSTMWIYRNLLEKPSIFIVMQIGVFDEIVWRIVRKPSRWGLGLHPASWRST